MKQQLHETILIADSLENFPLTTQLLQSFSAQEKSSNFFADLFDYFAIAHNEKYPIAALEALAENFPAGNWLRADPVHLQPDLMHVYLISLQSEEISFAEAQELQAELNQFLQQDDLQLLVNKNNQWYLRTLNDPEINTTPLQNVRGKDITRYLPQGEEGNYWQKLLTEIQMLLANSSVNVRRKNLGLPTINGLWFWGEGKLPTVAEVKWKCIYGDAELIKGLCLLAKVRYQELNDMSLNSENNLVVIINQSDLFLSKWIEQKLKDLRNKKLHLLIVNFSGKKIFKIEYKNLAPWWQKLWRIIG